MARPGTSGQLGPLRGRRALITGGSRGIGAAIALALAEDGADVVITFRREVDAAAAVVERCRALGRRAVAVQGTLAEPSDCEAIAAAGAECGGIDILVHNGGAGSRGLAVADTEREEVRSMLEVHAIGPHHLTRLCLPQLRAAKRSDVVFISSISADRFAKRQAPYTMAKVAMEALAHTLAKEEARNGVRVNIVAPGLVVTEMGRRFAQAAGNDIEGLDDRMPFGRVTRPDDVAGLVRFLVGPAGQQVTGQRVAVHGGT